MAPSCDRTQQINLQRRPCEGGGHSQGMKDGHQKLEEATDPPLEPLAGAQPTPRSQPSGPAGFKLLGLWGFVRAAPGSHPQYPRSTPLHFLIYSFASPPPQTPPLVTRMPLNSPVTHAPSLFWQNRAVTSRTSLNMFSLQLLVGTVGP